MTVVKRPDRAQITVTELWEFLRNPPAGFSVDSDFGVHVDLERNLVLIDDLDHRGQRVVFHKSLGRKVKVHNLMDYTSFRRSLLSKRIYLRACESVVRGDNREPKQYVVSLNGGDPFIKWQLERALDWTISSVAGESYRLEIDVRELLDRCRVRPGALWSDASFTLKYYSDALFDFPHWFGFSKRRVQVPVHAGSGSSERRSNSDSARSQAETDMKAGFRPLLRKLRRHLATMSREHVTRSGEDLLCPGGETDLLGLPLTSRRSTS